MLVAGKDMPSGGKFAEGLTFTNRNILITGTDIEIPESSNASDGDDLEKGSIKAGVKSVEWNKSSSLSARTLILQAENTYDRIDEAVLYFDEEYFASIAEKMDAAECSRTCDDLISGYMYLTLEILSRFEKKNSSGTPGKLVFLLKEGPCMVDALRAPVLRNGSNSIASPLVAAAAGAFASFAENIAAVYGDTEYVNIVLVRGDNGMEVAKADDSLAKWMGSYLDSVDGLKHKLTAKKSISWIKPGAKSAGGFSLFK